MSIQENDHNAMRNESDVTLKERSTKKHRSKKRRTRVLLGLLCILVAAGVTVGLAMENSRYPDAINS